MLGKRDLFLMIFGGSFQDRYGETVVKAIVKPRKTGIYKEDLIEVIGDYIDDDKKATIPSCKNGTIDPDYFSTGKVYQNITRRWFFEHHCCVLRDETDLRIYKLRRFSIWSNGLLAITSMNLSTRLLSRVLSLVEVSDWIQEIVLVLKDTGLVTLYNELTGPQRLVFFLSYASIPITLGSLLDVKYHILLKYLRSTVLQIVALNLRFIDFTAQFRQYCEKDAYVTIHSSHKSKKGENDEDGRWQGKQLQIPQQQKKKPGFVDYY